MSGSVSAALRRASSASSARASTHSLSSAETPSRRREAWAARPGTVSRNVIAPAWATTTSRSDGSVMIAMSPVTPARIAASVPCPPSSSDGTRATISSPLEPLEVAGRAERPDGRQDRGDAALHVAGATAVDRAVADLAAPRIGRPRRRIARRARRRDDRTGRSAGRRDRPTRPMTTGNERPRHLLARPGRVGADGAEIRADDLDRPARARAARRPPRPRSPPRSR